MRTVEMVEQGPVSECQRAVGKNVMDSFQNVMQVFTLLDKSNCRKCGEKTCLAFAAAVFRGEKDISACPLLSEELVARYSAVKGNKRTSEEAEAQLDVLLKNLQRLDFAEAAARTGGTLQDGRLSIKILGKDFSVSRRGEFFSTIHVNPWVTIPFLSYIINCQGSRLSGEWVSLRELDGGMERYPLFRKRCEEGMKRIGDVYTDLFDDMVHLFQGRQVESRFDADISVVLPVFPRVPLLICYWGAAEGMESSLNIFFDRSVDQNLGAESAFSLGSGLTQMFEKLAMQHGFSVQ